MAMHYSRLFPKLASFRPPEGALVALADRMIEPHDAPDVTSSIPAGYTYLGQFLIHDLSFERLPPGDGLLDPERVENLRTPRLDLESVYGDGPVCTPFLYRDDGVRMRVGWSDQAGGEDLPRTDPAQGESRRALIHDPRNDENVIIGQLHLAFIKFHNRVADVIERDAGLRGPQLFETVARTVRWHYQWIVVNDFLPRIVPAPILQTVRGGGKDRLFDLGAPDLIPVEFAVAAFRFGHSMVRARYMLEPWYAFPIVSTDPDQEDLRGCRELPAGTLISDWSHFFGPDAQLARKIDTLVVKPLTEIPGGRGARPVSLPLVDLRNGSRFGLPSGQAVATALQLTRDQQLHAEDFSELTATDAPPEVARFVDNTPLWYYCLKEAELFEQGSALGPVGGRIVSEVLLGVLLADPAAYLSANRGWLPETRFGAVQSREDGRIEFGIRELLAFAREQ